MIELVAIAITLFVLALQNLPFLVCMGAVAVVFVIGASLGKIFDFVIELPQLIKGCATAIVYLPLHVAAAVLVAAAFYLHEAKAPYEQFVFLMVLAIVMIVAQGWIVLRIVKRAYRETE